MDNEVTPGTILAAEPAIRGFSLKAWFLTAIFVVHAAVFTSIYLRRGRHRSDLLLVGGFVLLAAFYATSGWLSLAGVESEPRYLFVVRWAGVILCGLATPPFLIRSYRMIRSYRR